MTEIRPALPDDAAGIGAVHVASWRAAYRDLLPADMLASLSAEDRARFWGSILLEPPPRTSILVAVDGGHIVGFTAVGPSDDPSTGELRAIYLHPDHWRRGLGTRLNTAALAQLAGDGCTAATLWVLDGNERALAFYARTGWTTDGRRRTVAGPADIPLPVQCWRRSLP